MSGSTNPEERTDETERCCACMKGEGLICPDDCCVHDSGRVEPDPIDPRTDQAKQFDCDHHWISIHQPDFPEPIYWVQVCSQCGEINAADLALELAPLAAELVGLRAELQTARAQVHGAKRINDDLAAQSSRDSANLLRLRAEVTDLRQQAQRLRANANLWRLKAELEADNANDIGRGLAQAAEIVLDVLGAGEQTEPQPTMSRRYDELLTETGTPHDHREYVPGCFRCDLSQDELGVAGLTVDKEGQQ